VPHPDLTALGPSTAPTTEEQYERGPLPKKAPPSTNSSTPNGCGHKSACAEDRNPRFRGTYAHPTCEKTQKTMEKLEDNWPKYKACPKECQAKKAIYPAKRPHRQWSFSQNPSKSGMRSSKKLILMGNPRHKKAILLDFATQTTIK
jgi:hypothetical protein